MAQRYGTIAAHTRRRASVRVVFVVFCMHMYSFAGLIRRAPPRRSVTLQSPTATLIPLFSSSKLTGCGYSDLLNRKNRSGMCPRWESNPRLHACKASTLATRQNYTCILVKYIYWTNPFALLGVSGSVILRNPFRKMAECLVKCGNSGHLLLRLIWVCTICQSIPFSVSSL